MKIFFLPYLFVSTFSYVVSANTINQVYVEADEIGQGFLVQRLDTCYFVSPQHVLKNSFFITLKGSDKLRSLGEGQPLQPFGYDLAVGHVTGSLKTQCGINFNALSVNQQHIDKAQTVVVSTVNPDGLISRTPAVVQETELVYLSIKPSSLDRSFFKGMSGSLVYAEGDPIGMLQSVDIESGNGKVLRLDRLIETVSPFFSTSAQIANNDTQLMSNNIISYSLSYWNLPAISNEFSVQSLSDGDSTTVYITRLSTSYFEIDLTFSKMQDVSVLRLTLPEKSGIKDYEILTSRKAEGKRGWISSTSGTVLPNEAKTDISLGNVKTHRIKLKIHSSWHNDGLIKISEISVF